MRTDVEEIILWDWNLVCNYLEEGPASCSSDVRVSEHQREARRPELQNADNHSACRACRALWDTLWELHKDYRQEGRRWDPRSVKPLLEEGLWLVGRTWSCWPKCFGSQTESPPTRTTPLQHQARTQAASWKQSLLELVKLGLMEETIRWYPLAQKVHWSHHL